MNKKHKPLLPPPSNKKLVAELGQMYERAKVSMDKVSDNGIFYEYFKRMREQ